MYRKAHLTLKLTKYDVPLVKKQQKVTKGDPILKVTHEEVAELDLAKLLSVPPQNLPNYLKLKEGAPVTAGQVIARKGGVLSRQFIKSPRQGTFVFVDKEKGVVGVKNKHQDQEVTAWFDGTVSEMDREKIVFTVSGMSITAKAGKGAPTSGKLQVLGETTVLYLPVDVGNSVLAVKEAEPALIAKADTLGATAIIAEAIEEPPFSLPYLQFEDISVLSRYHNHIVIVLGDEKQLLVLDEKTEHRERVDAKREK